MLESLNQLSMSSSTTHTPTEPSSLFDAINELSDCESWKCNLIIYNLLETTTSNVSIDTSIFNDLSGSWE